MLVKCDRCGKEEDLDISTCYRTEWSMRYVSIKSATVVKTLCPSCEEVFIETISEFYNIKFNRKLFEEVTFDESDAQ